MCSLEWIDFSIFQFSYNFEVALQNKRRVNDKTVENRVFQTFGEKLIISHIISFRYSERLRRYGSMQTFRYASHSRRAPL